MNIVSATEKAKKDKTAIGIEEYFRLMTAYTPVFTSFEGGLYEMELTRAAVHCIAKHISKLDIIVEGQNNKALQNKLQISANPNMVMSQYLYKLATIFHVDNTAFIAPLFSERDYSVSGFYPLQPRHVTYKQYATGDYFKLNFNHGSVTIEKDAVGVMNQFLYNSDFFGASNAVLNPTMELINTNNQGIINGVKNSATIRFLAQLAHSLDEKDIKNARAQLTENNLTPENSDGVFLYDAKFKEVKQVNSEQYTVNAAQMRQIEENVFNYFGVNKKILQNNYTPDEWNAFYEGQIEPFAIQASLVHTKMTFTDREISVGNKIFFSTNRLQFESTDKKLAVVTGLFDRGMCTQNQGCDVFQLPHVPGGDNYYIRREYADKTELLDAADNNGGENDE